MPASTDPTEERFLSGRLFPPAKQFELASMELFRIEDGCRFVLKTENGQTGAEAGAALNELARLFWKAEPQIVTEPLDIPVPGPEEYRLDVSESEAVIRSAGRQGVLYALQTMRQLAENRRCADGISRWLLPAVRIQDAPALKFRGLHLCFFPETPPWEIERAIRLAAAYKYNCVILESWGTLRYSRHPEYCWDEYAQDPGFFKQLVHVARSLGIALCPQLNLFGHASQSRGATGKHALLDCHPEFDSLFEPDGWTFCLSNPDTRKFLTDLVEELLDIFENPPYFHIGCDEATSACTCLDCRRNGGYAQLVKDHIVYFHDLLAKRGCRALLWFDMFLLREGSKAVAPTGKGLQNLYLELPRDLIVCDVEYGYLPSGDIPFEWAVSKTCHDLGYSVVAAPWDEPTGTENLCRHAAKLGLDGMLCTTWHHSNHPDMPLFFQTAGTFAWNPCAEDPSGKKDLFHRNLRFVCRDMGLKSYPMFGSAQFQIAPQSFDSYDPPALRKILRKLKLLS